MLTRHTNSKVASMISARLCYSQEQLTPQARSDIGLDAVLRGQVLACDAKHAIFPQFKGANSMFFKQYREACYEEIRAIHASNQTPRNTVTRRAVTPSPESRFRLVRKRTRSLSKTVQRSKKSLPTWQDIPDHVPSLCTLDHTTRTLSVTWHASPRDVSRDEGAEFLHAQEKKIASQLRLPAPQYLAVKRLMFSRRQEMLDLHLPYTKTMAQNVCNIDVNKTSQLYEAYQRVGWID